MKKLFSCFLFLYGCIFCLTGCGKEDAAVNSGESSVPVRDWKQEGFAVLGEVTEEQGFWAQEFIAWEHREVVVDPQTEKLDDGVRLIEVGALDGKVYRLNTVMRPPRGRAVRWILEIYDTASMQAEVREFTPEDLGLQEEGKDCFLVGMDLIDAESYVFQWTEIDENEEGLNYYQSADKRVYSNLQGEAAAVDLWGTCLEQGIFKEEYNDYVWIPSGSCVCDGAGNTYVRGGESGYGYRRLAAFDREGKLLLTYGVSEEETFEEPLRTEAGELIYPVYNMRKKYYELLWADVETGEMKSLATFESSRRIQQFYGMEGNDVYYEMPEGIVRWNIESGERTLVFLYRENGIGNGYETMLVLREGQLPLLRIYGEYQGEEPVDWLAPLSDRPVERETVRVVDLTGGQGDRQAAECAALASRRDPNRGFTYESATQGAEDFRTRIMAELAAGKGPDILYVSRSDLEILHDAGLLADLREVLSEETLEELLPGVIGLGTVDGELAGMPGGVQVEGLMVSADVWSEPTWRLEDFTALVEAGKLEGLAFYNNSYFASLAMMRLFTEYSLADSFLIDWENRESHFEDERYLRFLRAVDIDRERLELDAGTKLKGGKRVAFLTLMSERMLLDFGASMKRENGFCVGLPTEGDAGNYLTAEGVIAVNANTDKREAARVFLEYFLGEQIQGLNDNLLNPWLGVRKLSPEDLEWDEEGRCFWHGEEVTVFEDGTTALHVAEELLESCVPAPAIDPVVSRILFEELEALYMDSARQPEQAADAIDRRIQIYLDEGE
ncbi:MAG: ABC transporter substrate-binding protein [Roseburia sp.]|nr:ABC transporter substrate-binding protein [Roseburia sp.]MCM1097961.1 ABC transporter substrate-binding protein [Ruminococcus flavefaciens]